MGGLERWKFGMTIFFPIVSVDKSHFCPHWSFAKHMLPVIKSLPISGLVSPLRLKPNR